MQRPDSKYNVVSISKDYLKFSCAHFTILGPSKRESLHGHDYYLSLEVEYPTSSFIDYNVFKKQLKLICELLDEKTLIPKNSPVIKIKKNKANIEVIFKDDFFSFPEKDVLVLPVSNTTLEEISHYLFGLLVKNKTLKQCNVRNLTLHLDNCGQSSIVNGIVNE